MKTWQVVGALAIVVIIILAFQPNNPISNSLSSFTTQNAVQSVNANLCSATKLLQLTAYDGLAYTQLNAPTITMLSGVAPYQQLESGAASSTGVYTTGNKYVTGTTLVVEISGASTVTEFTKITVPPVTCSDTSSTNAFSVYAPVLGAWTNTLTGAGSTFTSGKNYLITAFSGNSVTINMQIAQNTKNDGYKSSYDYTNSVYNYFVVEVATTGTSLGITGFQLSAVKGSSTYYLTVCPDGIAGQGFGQSGGSGAYTANTGGATIQSVGTYTTNCTGSLSLQTIGTSNFGGLASMQFTISKGSLGTSSTQAITIKELYYSDPNNFITTNSYGPNSAQSGSTITLTFVAP